jgi:hypothetical protein
MVSDNEKQIWLTKPVHQELKLLATKNEVTMREFVSKLLEMYKDVKGEN